MHVCVYMIVSIRYCYSVCGEQDVGRAEVRKRESIKYKGGGWEELPKA